MIPNMSFAIGYSSEYGALQNNLFSIQKKLDKTMENLSTGSKVNDMKDDMSGKAIADVLQSWKVGTDEAIENLKEFISFTKTAENALDKLQEILFDMKQTVDRLTGIDNPSENGMAQNELEANLMAYERIVEQTQFKGWKVFDEGFMYLDTGNAAGMNTFRYRNFRFAAGRENSMTWDLGLAPKSYNVGKVKQYEFNTFILVSAGSFDAEGIVASDGYKLTTQIVGLVTDGNNSTSDNVTLSSGEQIYDSVAGEITSTGGFVGVIRKGDVIINGIDLFEAAKAVDPTVKESTGINRIDILEKALEYAFGGNASVQVVLESQNLTYLRATSIASLGADWAVASASSVATAGLLKVKFYINVPNEFDLAGKGMGDSTAVNTALGAMFGVATKDSAGNVAWGTLKQEAMQLLPNSTLNFVNAMGNRADYNDGAWQELIYDATGNAIDMSRFEEMFLVYDSAADSDATANITGFRGKTEETAINTNLNTVNVLGMEQAGDAKVIIEAAIQQIDEMRGILAAYQKQAEYLISNRQVESNKVEAQVSQLTETDYAEELAKLTKQQIVQQAGVNMLAQKRQMAQLITQLLR
ncbi:flagellin N-terminal helical domain-containing protein [Desulfurobacterium crinifex]